MSQKAMYAAEEQAMAGGPPKYTVSEVPTVTSDFQANDLEANSYPPSIYAPSAFGPQLRKPVVVPQSTNIFFIKTFSPFARSYSSALSSLDQPIHQEEFLSFIDGLNDAFLSAPFFQAMHIAGGALLSTNILPVQGAGAGLQIVSVLGSAGVSFVRVRSYMKKANQNLFVPRGLTAKIMTTKKMMAALGVQNADGTMKLKLPPLDDIEDLNLSTYASTQANLKVNGQVPGDRTGKHDPRIGRLQALQQYISPLTFNVPEDTRKVNWLKRTSEAPLKWVNKRQMEKMEKAKQKSLKKRESLQPEVERRTADTTNELAVIERRISHARANSQASATSANSDGEVVAIDVSGNPAVPVSDEELKALEQDMGTLLQRRDTAIKEIHASGDKKLEKLYKKEEKIANRILWIVIERADGHALRDEELFEVAEDGESPA